MFICCASIIGLSLYFFIVHFSFRFTFYFFIFVWTFAVSQPFTQFYSVDVSEQDTTRIVGGAQDNGANRSYGGTNWNTYITGDGEEALIDPADQNNVYGCFQYGECSRSTNGGTTSSKIGRASCR